jgi:hypothetical protein
LQTSVDWQFVVFSGRHPTHFFEAGSQTLKLGPHAAQSALVSHEIVGTPFASSPH